MTNDWRSDDAGPMVGHGGQSLVADPDPADHPAPGVDELPQPRRARAGPPLAGDRIPRHGHNPDHPRAGASPVGAGHRPPDDDVSDRRLQQHPQGAPEGGARLRDRGVEEAAAGRHVRRGRLRPRAAGRGAAGAQRAQPDGDREHHRPREHRLRRGRQTGPGHVSRGHRAAAGRALRRQREPRQPARAGPGRQGAGGAGQRAADRVLLRSRGAGREGLDPARRQDERDGQHQRRDPRQRAHAGHAPDLSEIRRRPPAGRRQRQARAGRTRPRRQRPDPQAGHQRAQLLHLQRPVHPRGG